MGTRAYKSRPYYGIQKRQNRQKMLVTIVGARFISPGAHHMYLFQPLNATHTQNK
jgi:hypothetical protein